MGLRRMSGGSAASATVDTVNPWVPAYAHSVIQDTAQSRKAELHDNSELGDGSILMYCPS